jgi:hypothetical protein
VWSLEFRFPRKSLGNLEDEHRGAAPARLLMVKFTGALRLVMDVEHSAFSRLSNVQPRKMSYPSPGSGPMLLISLAGSIKGSEALASGSGKIPTGQKAGLKLFLIHEKL